MCSRAAIEAPRPRHVRRQKIVKDAE